MHTQGREKVVYRMATEDNLQDFVRSHGSDEEQDSAHHLDVCLEEISDNLGDTATVWTPCSKAQMNCSVVVHTTWDVVLSNTNSLHVLVFTMRASREHRTTNSLVTRKQFVLHAFFNRSI